MPDEYRFFVDGRIPVLKLHHDGYLDEMRAQDASGYYERGSSIT
jgi:hypothetical protein